MEFSLTIKGSASAIAMILANLPPEAAGSVSAAPIPAPVPLPAPVAAAPAIPPMPVATGDEGDSDDGPVNAAAPATDATGLPWDERIHAGTKGVNADGSWKKRRGAAADLVTSVEAELRAGLAAPAVVTPPPPPVAMPAPVAVAPVPLPVAAPALPVPVMPPVAAPTPLPVPMPAPEPVAPAPAPAPIVAAVAAATGEMDFAQFMQHLSGQMQKVDGAGAPLIHADYLANVAQRMSAAFGVPFNSITDMSEANADPRWLPYCVQLITADGRW